MWKSENEYRIIGLQYVFFGCLISILFWIEPMNQFSWSRFWFFWIDPMIIPPEISPTAIMFSWLINFTIGVMMLGITVSQLVLVLLGLVLAGRGGERIASASKKLFKFVIICYLGQTTYNFVMFYGVGH